jgi:arylformamidase
MNTFDQQLNLRARHPDFQTFIDQNNRESKRVREQYKCYLNQAYGDDPLQSIDVFPATQPNAPALVFIHGGYWRALDKVSYSFVAEPFIKNHFSVFVINYRLIPKVDMKTLVNDVINAIQWVSNKAEQYNANPDCLILSGHSAGGHLSFMTYLLEQNLRNSIKAICSISGVFDLQPIKESYLNEVLQLDADTVNTYSLSSYNLAAINCPMLISVGLNESTLFIEQSEQLYAQNQHTPQLQYLELPHLNHYQTIHQLANEKSSLTSFILKNGAVL